MQYSRLVCTLKWSHYQLLAFIVITFTQATQVRIYLKVISISTIANGYMAQALSSNSLSQEFHSSWRLEKSLYMTWQPIHKRAHHPAFLWYLPHQLSQMIIVHKLPLNLTGIIFSWIFSMLFDDFKAWGLRSTSIFIMMALTEYFHVDANINVNPLSGSWYFSSSSLW